MPSSPLPIVVLISGSGSNLQAIIDAIGTLQLNAEIKAVISNKAGVKGLERAEKAGIPTRVLQHTDFDSREAFDQALAGLIDDFNPRLVILAGFMRILSEDFVTHYMGRMLNIHPSLLPDFTGLNTHQRVLDAGRSQHGVSVHFVTNELDSGPLVIQAVIDINPEDTADSLAERIHQQEHIIYPTSIQWFAEGRLCWKDNQAWLDDKPIRVPPRWQNGQLIYKPDVT
ncbi:MAG: phosphoribosylglycinamide formyltransferase [Gammaproteobacteria bacterium]|nr:phosphoribosylglycinamide formyltransferase [Gammaproteobacteria bacterium]